MKWGCGTFVVTNRLQREKMEILRLRISKTEKEVARKEAGKLGISMSAFIRLLLRQWSDGIKFERRTPNE